MLKDIPGGRLETSAANSWLRLRYRIAQATGVYIAPTSSRCTYRTFAEQQYFWDEYQAGRGSLAAVPGTSAHGLGIAVDVATPEMALLINKLGAPYGWQKKWSDGASEWWHFKYAAVHDTHKGSPTPGRRSRRSDLTSSEKYYRDVLVRERTSAKRHGGYDKLSDEHRSRAVDAKEWIKKRCLQIEDDAKDTGWHKNDRRTRHDYLKAILDGGT